MLHEGVHEKETKQNIELNSNETWQWQQECIWYISSCFKPLWGTYTTTSIYMLVHNSLLSKSNTNTHTESQKWILLKTT